MERSGNSPSEAKGLPRANAPAPRGNAQFARFWGTLSQSPSARGKAELARRLRGEVEPQTPPRRARWGNDQVWTNTGTSLAESPHAGGRGAEVFFSVVLKRDKPPPLARFQSRFLSRSLSFLSRFSTHDPTHRRLLTHFSTSSQPLRFADGAERGGVRRRGLSTSHQTGFNSLAAARPVVASASFLSSRRAKPPRQLAKGRRGCPRRPAAPFVGNRKIILLRQPTR